MFVSKIDPQIDYNFVLSQPEWQYFDRKSFRSKPTEIANDIIWMANAQGWVIAVWIHNGELDYSSDISWHKYNDFFQIVENFIHPSPRLKVEEVSVEDKKILLFHIDTSVELLFERSETKKVFLRVGDETKELNHHQIENLKYDKELRAFEDTVCRDFDVKEFRVSLLDHYKERLKFTWTYQELLLSRNLAKKIDTKVFYQNSAILLFCENPEKYIPSSHIRYVRYDGNYETSGTSYNLVKDERFEWPIPVQIEKAKRFLWNVLKEYVYLNIETWRFQETLEFPEEAWLEWIVNAVTHRSYNRNGNPIMIKHYDNRIEISNSWPLPSNVTVENIRTTRYSRNPRIARVLFELWYVRELNEWVKRIYSSMEKALLWDPVYQDKDNVITLTLQNNVQKHSKMFASNTFDKINKEFQSLAEKEKKIIIILFKQGKAKTSEIEEGLQSARATTVKYLRTLTEKWLIKKVGKSDNDPKSYYTFV